MNTKGIKRTLNLSYTFVGLSLVVVVTAHQFSLHKAFIIAAGLIGFVSALIMALNWSKLLDVGLSNESRTDVGLRSLFSREKVPLSDYLKSWPRKHPFTIMFSIGFVWEIYFGEISWEIIQIIYPFINPVPGWAFALLSVFLFFDLVGFLLQSRLNGLAKLLFWIVCLCFSFAYIFVGITGAMALIIDGYELFLSGLIKALARELPPWTVYAILVLFLVAGKAGINYTTRKVETE